MPHDGRAVLVEGRVPADVIAMVVVMTTYLIGSGEIFAIASLILRRNGANWVSTMMMPSVPTA